MHITLSARNLSENVHVGWSCPCPQLKLTTLAHYMLHWSFSARPVLMTILGGAGTFWGPAVGSAIFFVLEHWVTAFTENWMIVLGSLLIPVVLFFPRGIWGTLTHAFRERTKRF